jgi:uncharacterized membrane protein
LGSLPGGSGESTALGVSGDGSVIVGGSDSASDWQAFIWDATHGMRSLKEVLENDYGLDLKGWQLHESVATGISADGCTIVGYGINPDGYGEAWIATMPEPATLSLLAVGGLMVLRRRR